MKTIYMRYMGFLMALLIFIEFVFDESIKVIFNKNVNITLWLIAIIVGVILIFIFSKYLGKINENVLKQSFIVFSFYFIPLSVIAIGMYANAIMMTLFQGNSMIFINPPINVLIIYVIKHIIISLILIIFLKKHKNIDESVINDLYYISIVMVALSLSKEILIEFFHRVTSGYNNIVNFSLGQLIMFMLFYILLRITLKILKFKVDKINVKSVIHFTFSYMIFSSILFVNFDLFKLFELLKHMETNPVLPKFYIVKIAVDIILIIIGFMLYRVSKLMLNININD